MTLLKAEIKASTAFDIGEAIENRFEAATREMYRFEGAHGGLKEAVGKILSLQAHVKQDLSAEKYPELTSESAKVVLLYITRAANIVENLADQAASCRLVEKGKADGLKAAMEVAKKVHGEQAAKLEVAAAAEARGEDPEEALRPGARSDLQQRRIEATAAREAAKLAEAANPPVAPDEAPPPVPQQEVLTASEDPEVDAEPPSPCLGAAPPLERPLAPTLAGIPPTPPPSRTRSRANGRRKYAPDA